MQADWTQHVVISNAETKRGYEVLVGEFLGTSYPNGNLDVIASFHGTDTDDWEDGMVWSAFNYYWAGDMIYFTELVVEDYMPAAAGLAAGDVDDDGYDEVIGASWAQGPDGFIAWWEHNGSTGWELGATIATGLAQAANLAIGDIDGDGDEDVVATLWGTGGGANGDGSLLVWYENDEGDGSSWIEHEIDTIVHPYAVAVGQLDLDTPLDIVVTSTDIFDADNDNGVYIYYGLGGDPDWFNDDADKTFDLGNLKSPRSVAIADWDVDGLFDLVVAFTGDRYTGLGEDIVVAFAEEGEFEDIDWVTMSVDPNFNTCRDVYIGDFDQDGDFDVASSSLWANRIDWFNNPRDPNHEDPWGHEYIGTCNIGKGVGVGDFNDDDYPDVVAAFYQLPSYNDSSFVYLYINDGAGDALDSNPLSITVQSQVPVNGSLSYSYSFTLDDTSEVELFAWYKVISPDLYITVQFPVDTLGTLPGTYTGNGSLTIPESLFSTGDRCQFFLGVGYLVYSDDDTPAEMLHGYISESSWFDVTEPNDLSGDEDISVSATPLPLDYSIMNIHPNPFNPTVSFDVTLPEISNLNVTIFDVMGRQVATLAADEFAAGEHGFIFDGSNYASGVYFVRGTVPGHMDQVRKLALLK